MSRVFFDTNLFIYLIEDEGPLAKRVEYVLKQMAIRQDELLISTLTLGEVLVRPIEKGSRDWIRRYEQALQQPGIALVPFGVEAARIYAEIRAGSRLKPPDAVQLACAAAARCDLFLTNAPRLSRQHVRGIQFITSLAHAPF